MENAESDKEEFLRLLEELEILGKRILGIEKTGKELERRSDIDYSLPPTPPMRPGLEPESKNRPWVRREMSPEETSAILATINPKDPTKTIEQQIHQLWLDGCEQHEGVWYRWYQKNLTQQVGSVDRIPAPSNADIVGISYANAHKAINDLMRRSGGFPGLLLDESTDRNVKDYK